jgi:phosphoribosyl 1,2-cyclic phosphodiesterase
MHQFGIDPTKLDGLLISHCHPDHYNDAEILIEAMTLGGREKRGVVASSTSVLNGYEDYGPAISNYHRGLPEYCSSLEFDKDLYINKLFVKSAPAFHSDPSTISFKVFSRNGIISYIPDTAYDDMLVRAHSGSRVLIVSMTRPRNGRIPHHLCSEDVVELLRGIQPETTFLTHLGLRILKNNLAAKEAKWIEEQTGVRTVAAVDGMRVNMGKELDIHWK